LFLFTFLIVFVDLVESFDTTNYHSCYSFVSLSFKMRGFTKKWPMGLASFHWQLLRGLTCKWPRSLCIKGCSQTIGLIQLCYSSWHTPWTVQLWHVLWHCCCSLGSTVPFVPGYYGYSNHSLDWPVRCTGYRLWAHRIPVILEFQTVNYGQQIDSRKLEIDWNYQNSARIPFWTVIYCSWWKLWKTGRCNWA